MGGIVLIITTIFLLYFLFKRCREKKKFKNTIEQFGEIKLRHQKKNQIIIKTKEGEITLQTTPKDFMSLGVGVIGIFRYNKEDLQLVSFTPYQKL